jgi:ribosomal protein S18 acetylase RimI-like enzyme
MIVRPLREDEWAAWEAHSRGAYAGHLVRMAGFTPAQARAKAEADYAALLPAGAATPRQHVLAGEVDGAPAGAVWLSERDQAGTRRMAWVHDLEVRHAFRGRGHGRTLMLAAEDLARALGLDRIGLNVYAGNDAALALYRALGYETTRHHEHGFHLGKGL